MLAMAMACICMHARGVCCAFWLSSHPPPPPPQTPTPNPPSRQLLSRYRRKAALFAGKALVELREYAAALPVLEAAKQVSGGAVQ